MMKELIKKLNAATLAYDQGHPIMSDSQWDNLYFELARLEKETGIYYPDSPTQKISFQVVNNLQKVTHSHEMLSLEKTKSLSDVLPSSESLAMLKEDGLTVSLRYLNGKLVSAETRGNGIVGEDILHNALTLKSIPKKIDYKEELIVDGEVICKISDFEKFSDSFRNPRNFASGSIRLLDSRECGRRNLSFIAWEVIKGFEETNKLSERLEKLSKLNFDVVPFILHWDINSIEEDMRALAKERSHPIDGIVFKYNDIEKGATLGKTSHHFKNAIAYKFYDETYESHLKYVEWNMGRTGVLTPVAIFDPIEIEGTIVERASLHNISIMQETLHGNGFLGQTVYISKRNMIIPQIEEAEENSDKEEFSIPAFCGVCGAPAQIIKSDGNVDNLYCANKDCEGKFLNKVIHFVGKQGLDIKGLSEATLIKLIDWGWINDFEDIFRLGSRRVEWSNREGFGAKSVENILSSIEAAKVTSLDKFLSSLGIPLIGESMAKELVKHITSYEDFREKINSHFDFSKYEGFAEMKSNSLLDFDYSSADKVYNYLTIEKEILTTSSDLLGKTIVITGNLTRFSNRDELQKLIEDAGGRVSSAVSRNTTFLINNDIASTSSKNQRAKELNIPILTEAEFLERYKLL